MEHGVACSLRTRTGTRLAEAVTEAARTAEEAGLASWWTVGDREAASDRSFDPLLGLQCAARATTRLRLATSGDLLSLASPAVRAKQLATLDWLSRGRAEVGLDLAEPPPVLADPFLEEERDSLEVALEHLAGMRALWTQDRAGHQGRVLSFAGAIALPKPVGARVPQTHVRATSTEVLERVVAAGVVPDGWLAWQQSADELVHGAGELAAVLGDAAEQVRRTWFVPVADYYAARDSVPGLGVRVDELVAVLDHVPAPVEVAALAA
ncbi:MULTISPECIES: LLM class flavin-dependent oxidoreductase [unclassified Nocardioides]|uniref:LLM class flavin-dependent oxidoreductase n=1 Tax=unclassified Nocardioides TaxID=2615069 RepID=UPI003014AB08